MLTDISSATLRKMVKLSERKEALMSEIQELDRQMTALEGEADEAKRIPRKGLIRSKTRGNSGTRMQRGALKAKILSALRAAGTRGMTIRQLSEKAGVKPANLYVWFNGTGRRTAGLKKMGPAQYRFVR